MSRTSRNALITLVVLLAVGVGVFFLINRPGASLPQGPSSGDPDPAPSATSPEPEEPPASPPPADPAAPWSTPITPVCGESLTAEDLDSHVRFVSAPEHLSPQDPFPVIVHNTAEAPIVAEVDRYDIAVPVLTDAEGTIVALAPAEPVLAEGYSVLAIAPGAGLTVPGTLRWAALCGEEPGAHEEPPALPEGEYQMFLLAHTGPFDDPKAAEQIQGGPFPITIDGDARHDVEEPDLTGGADVPACGEDWPASFDPLPGTLAAGSTPGLSPGDEGMLVMDGHLVLDTEVSGVNLFAHAVILSSEQVVGPAPHASDNLIGWYASAGLGAEVATYFTPLTCEGEALAAGDYEVVMVVSTIDGGMSTVAVSEPVDYRVDQ